MDNREEELHKEETVDTLRKKLEALEVLVNTRGVDNRGVLFEDLVVGKESPLQYFLTFVLDELRTALPHRVGDSSDKENQFLSQRNRILTKFNKELKTSVARLLSQTLILFLNERPPVIIKFDKPTRAIGSERKKG